MRYSIFLLAFIGLTFLGCSVKYEHINLNSKNELIVTKQDIQIQKRIEELSLNIQHLSKSVSPKDANDIAYKTTYYAMHLANDYALVAPALFQNYLVNQKKKERGLCYHWVTDILKYLENSDYKTLGIYKVVANKGEYNEHNAISITAFYETFDKGILLDAWRDSGKLFFIPIQEDSIYDWKLRKKIQ
ncbi:MAG: hypothetical protein U9N30_10210 [Campylobacterota bacterium]|nr:hypothetical protein [Campylobacterota bacterium]